jgi:hypothetical protein
MNMKTGILCAALSLAAAVHGTAAVTDWKPAQGPLMTRWAKDVTPETAHREYPRPQLVREDWLNLNGLWDYAITAAPASEPKSYEGKILVPFPIESALSGVMRRFDEKSTLWYRRAFEIPKAWAGRRVRIHFGAVDWQATVQVNGRELGVHHGGYDGFSLDLTQALKPEGPQEIIVAVQDPTEADQPRGKQSRKPEGIFYTPASGIWQTVWLEPVAEVCIDDLKLVPDVPGKALRVQGAVASLADDLEIEAVALADGVEVGRAHGPVNADFSLPLQKLELWSPAHPFLYDLKVTLKKGGKVIDSLTSYFGMRKIELRKDAQGINRLMLNDEFIFQVGTLDQGFWPDGIYTAPTDAALRYDLEVLKQLGFNMTRKHVKVEPERWYYWCDKMGLLVWQDMPGGNNGTKDAKRQFEAELRRMIAGRENHPSIILWVVFNEGWGQYDTERLAQWVKSLDPSRLVNNASGWTDKKAGDVIDMHNYPGPGSPPVEASRAAVLGEFGGLGLAVDGHTWSRQTWGYQGMSDSKKLSDQYARLLSRAWTLKDNPGLCAVVYTQTTDVETECNGLMTYDRAVIKVNAELAAAANKGEIADASPTFKVLAPNAQHGQVSWNYTFEKPANNWFQPAFDTAKWKTGRGGFGTAETPSALLGTEWKTGDIWLRREFELDAGNLGPVELQMHHDEDAEVYLNGVLAVKAGSFVSSYEEYDLTPASIATLKPGRNVMAIHCHQTAGGQYIDAGLVVPIPRARK